ncbi:hypothetical protein TWF696_000361 [Orbilia brochopaga]|uniref:Endonuclease/exonuclease/phosphatase domain-containing protein n=1 Tax=Orbilia brochopaga TaxID=3140254 RepID=A0AAV9VEM4_9PEZI
MLFSSIFSAAASALLFSTSLVQAAPAPAPSDPALAAGGTLAVIAGDLVTLSYSTNDPADNNWIGIWHANGGPVGEVKVDPSLTWSYVKAAKGTLHLDVSGFEGGQYRAFFLSRDGYRSLANPVTFNVPGQAPQGFSFVTGAITLQNARQRDAYTARLAGLVSGAKGGVQFSKSSGPQWVQVSADGVLSGRPDASGTANVVVRATSGGATTNLQINIPVRRAGTPLVSEIRVLTFNLWIGGTHVSNYHNKQIKFILEQNIDILGVQESTGAHATRIAKALGWWVYEAGDLGIISRYPIVEEYGHISASIGVRIALDGAAKQINFWDAHFSAYPYGPYDLCFDKQSVDFAMKREASSGRAQQVADTLKAMAPQIAAANNIPVILMGDTNAPSHLDWTDRNKHCGYGNVPWPTSVKPLQAGLIDSFRAVHPDPAAVPGTTWSPIYPFNEGTTGKVEPQDRIDIIYHAGSMTPIDSRVVMAGNPRPYGQHGNNEWTSDHAAVLTTYRL